MNALRLRYFIAIFSCQVFASLVYAEGPIQSHKDPTVQQEFENVYKDVRNKVAKTINESSGTISSFIATSITASSITATGQLIGGGTVTNDDASQYQIGWSTHQQVLRASGVTPLTTVTTALGNPLFLTGGDYELSFSPTMEFPSDYNGTELRVAISTRSATMPTSSPTNNNKIGVPDSVGQVEVYLSTKVASGPVTVYVPPVRVSVPAGETRPFYMLFNNTYSAGGPTVYGFMRAWRRR